MELAEKGGEMVCKRPGELLALLPNREKVKVTESGPTLRILQARILK